MKSDSTALPPIVKMHGAGHPNTKRIGIKVKNGRRFSIYLTVLTAGAGGIMRGLVLIPKHQLRDFFLRRRGEGTKTTETRAPQRNNLKTRLKRTRKKADKDNNFALKSMVENSYLRLSVTS